MTLVQQALARIEEMEKRAEAATPGPWRVEQPWGGFSAIRRGDDPLLFTSSVGCRNAENDHVFIAAARTDLPDVLALVKAFLRQYADAEDWSEAYNTPEQTAALKAFVEPK